RIAPQGERGREGLVGADSGPRGRARSHRQLVVRGTGFLRVHPVSSAVKRIAILGSTGSIGQSALAVVAAHPERLRVVALAAGENVPRFVEQVRQFEPDTIAMATRSALADAQLLLAGGGGFTPRTTACGADGLIAAATHPDADVVLFASS